jgi:hypothetical protein
MIDKKTAMWMPGVTVIQDFQTERIVDNEEAIQAHNAGRLQQDIAGVLRKYFKKKGFEGSPNCPEVRHRIRAAVHDVLRHVEQLGLLDSQLPEIDVRADDWIDHILDGGEPDPTMVRVDAPKRTMIMRLYDALDKGGLLGELDDDFEQECPTDISP